ncbi:lipocalin-like domain-containing protein [Roseitranquillus sediminis]|uniref:lipocalin-like domain-containing protein n=1 Tax=Roseitranquillus sediminis TaxID=2809051 RepID=UPI001D0C96EB|nr:lipocalin-like domain-containing protein [Roseitranquillus sediminis]MBM9595665.1 iron ABC transporter permease [Roseitranquillus sediminis]
MSVDHTIRAAVALALFAANAAFGQGYAGLASDAEGFALPHPDYRLEFPADHGPHPDFRIEWWYVTANLEGPDGTNYGIQWTLFRTALRPGEAEAWASPQIWFGHAAVTTPETHLFSERFARGGIGQAGVEAAPFDAWIDEWRMWGPTISDVTLTAAGDDFAYRLELQAEGPLVLHGDDGYSVKSDEGQASHYYSQPSYLARGTLTLPEGEVQVEGRAWLDREWSSQPLSDRQTGWDWFSLHFENGAAMMGYFMRQTDGAPYAVATWIAPDGTGTPLPEGVLEAEPLETATVEDREIPVAWRLRLPPRDLDVEVRALNPQSWMGTTFSYWEGPVTVMGSHEGRGYLEMTGYE